MITHLDLRSEGPPADVVRERYRVRAGRVVVRDPSTIDGVVIHQTACTFGPADDADKRHRRALRIPAHATAFRDGVFVTPCPLDWYAQHGNALNARSLGLEIEGRYAGLLDDPATVPREDIGSTWGGPPDVVTSRVVETALAALRWLVEQGSDAGMPIRYVWAHRQSSPDRRPDPGAELWQRVALVGAADLGLEVQLGETFHPPWQPWKKGRPIPRAWDARASAAY